MQDVVYDGTTYSIPLIVHSTNAPGVPQTIRKVHKMNVVFRINFTVSSIPEFI